MPSDFDLLDDELAEVDGRENELKKKTSWVIPLIVAIIALVSFSVIVFYAYNRGIHEGSENAAPILRTEGPSKVPPQTPGGLEIPNQDKLVYNRIGEQQVGEAVERILPPPEIPLPEPTTNEKTVTVPPPPKLSVPITGVELSTLPVVTTVPTQKLLTPVTRLAVQPSQTAELPTILASVTDTSQSPFRVQIASMTTPDAANIEWRRRLEQHKDLLGGLILIVGRAEIAGKGIFYRVQVGPLPSREAANELCGKLKQRKVGCLVVQK